MTQYTHHGLERKLLSAMWPHIWQRGRMEFKMLGIPYEVSEQIFAEMASKAIAGGVLCADGKPLFALGVMIEDGENVTFFQATEDFDEHAWEITEVIRHKSDEFKGPLVIYSVLSHPKTEKWFRCLGFARDKSYEGRTVIGFPMYKFIRSADPCASAAVAAAVTAQ